MFIHNLDPVIINFGILSIRWYSLAYIFGILIGWWYGNKIILKKFDAERAKTDVKIFDELITYIIISIVIGGRVGYVLFYQTNLFFLKPLYILEIWNGGMSFHGGLLGIIISIFFFCKINKISFYYLSDLVSIVAPIGLFFGRIANFINTELIGRPTEFYISVIYPSIDNIPRHPSQLYEAFFEGIVLFIILIFYFFKTKKNNNHGIISGLFLSIYSFFRFFIEFLREPDLHLGLFFNFISMGQLLSVPIFIFGIILITYNGYKKSN